MQDQTRALVEKAVTHIKAKSRITHFSTGLVLGSGLKASVPKLERAVSIPFEEIPGIPKATVAGHAGNVVAGLWKKTGVLILQGRLHYYEGHPLAAVTLPVRVMAGLGIRNLVITSAVGSMARGIKPGTLVFLKDHINFMGSNPLIGTHHLENGQMFPDLSEPYSRDLRRLAARCSKALKIPAREGVFVAVSGPSYETKAEIRAFRRLGGDVVGMSMVPEAIVANQTGMKVLGISWVANYASGLSAASLKHPDVLKLGKKISAQMRSLMESLLNLLPAEPKRL
ncbi:MAG: purine-nucleoside phosphorylase [Elusimicrobia bacterium]|nr:purine-nucleoside phosphorylase [Elusimicrobiota bacterium]